MLARMLARIVAIVLVVALCAGVVFAIVTGYELWRDSKLDEGDARGAARIKGLWDADRAQAQATAIEQGRQSAAETLRRLNKHQENQRAQDVLLASARRDRDGAVAAADGLRLRAAAYLDAAGCSARAGDSALECVRAAAAQIGDVLGQCAARHQQLAEAADDARIRGLKCEADYDGLTLKP